jgi:hypothetical protein
MSTSSLRPWYGCAMPHEDIRERRLDEAVFAANVWAVAQGTAPEVYLNPEEFFRKTHMTVGLQTILKRVSSALRGEADAGDRIISLQTAFGGGKTHALVALWHLAKHASELASEGELDKLREAVGGRSPEAVNGVAVFTNATCDPTQGRKTPEGIHTRTLWGELALQLGGTALYDVIRANDETQRVPQGLFTDVLRQATPCLILLDELADYCVGAAAVPVGDTSLADQTISFIQQLTEAVQQIPGAVVIATLPASKYEVAQSEKGQEAFVTLEKRFQRLGSDIKPVADDEIYEVVRARLFEPLTSPEDKSTISMVGDAYMSMYTGHANEVAPEVTRGTYKQLIERAYPFHPTLIDTLYKRWGSHPDFQRTRGVLRLLATLVADLWIKRDATTESQPLIQPCHVRWSLDPWQAALTRLWGPGFQSVAAADVIGSDSNAGLVDEERGGDYRRERIGRGLASAILLGSFGGQAQRSGFSAKDLKVACSRPSLNWNYADGALLDLEDRCHYLHSTAARSLGKRYWFDTKPHLNKLIVQYRQQVSGEAFDEDILETIRVESTKGHGVGATWRVIVDPSTDLPEQKVLTLLVMSPSLSWDEGNGGQSLESMVQKLSSLCGTRDRVYRNTLIFLAGSSRGLSKLRNALRERAALQRIRSDYGTQLDTEQQEDLKKRLDASERAVMEALGPAYTVAFRIQGSEVDVANLPDARPSLSDHLGYVWSTLVEDEEWILRSIGSVTLEKTGLVPKEGGIRVKDAVEAFLRFTDKPMIASKDAVSAGLTQACRDGVIGLGRGTSPTSLHSRHCQEDVSVDPTEEGLWIIPAFEPKSDEGLLPTGTDAVPGTEIETPESGGDVSLVGTVRRVTIRGAVPMENWGELFRAFVSPSARMKLRRQRLGVEFELEFAPDSLPTADDANLKAMKEAALQLGLEIEISEQ